MSYEIMISNDRYVEDSPNADNKSVVQGKIVDILTVNKSWEKNGNIKVKHAILDCGINIWLQISPTSEITTGRNLKIVGRLDIIRK